MAFKTARGMVSLCSLAGAGRPSAPCQPSQYMRLRTVVYRLELSVQTVGQAFGFLGVREAYTPRCDQGRRRSGTTLHAFRHLPQTLVLGIPVSHPTGHSPLVQMVGQRPVQVVDLISQSEVPSDLPLPA